MKNNEVFGKLVRHVWQNMQYSSTREREREDLITPTNVKFLQFSAAPSYSANAFISNTRAIYQVKSLQEVTAPSNFNKGIVTYLLAE